MVEHWIDPKFTKNESIFQKRVTDVRKQLSFNINEREALDATSSLAPVQYEEVEAQLSDDEIDQLAFYDQETGTYNFRYLIRTFYREVKRSTRYKRELSILVVSLDRLLAIGSEHGVLVIDQVIAAASEKLIATCRSDLDMIGRYTEGSFLILLPETSAEQALRVAERITQSLQSISIAYRWHEIKVMASIGIANFPQHGDDIESLIAHADLCAETLSSKGGNGFRSNLYSV
jgi:diguanylate cyclase (GGDEF)-like protein